MAIKRDVISRGSTWTPGKRSLLNNKALCRGIVPGIGGEKGRGMEEAIGSKIDALVWEWCQTHRPDLAKPGSWYKENGIHAKIMALMDVIQEDEQ